MNDFFVVAKINWSVVINLYNMQINSLFLNYLIKDSTIHFIKLNINVFLVTHMCLHKPDSTYSKYLQNSVSFEERLKKI